MLVGYACVDRSDGDIGPQFEALRVAGCETIFEDPGTPVSATDRPGLAAALDGAMVFDTLVVLRLDRLAASLPDRVRLLAELTSVRRSRNGRKPKLTADQARLARKLIEGGETRQSVAQSFLGYPSRPFGQRCVATSWRQEATEKEVHLRPFFQLFQRVRARRERQPWANYLYLWAQNWYTFV